MEELQSDWAKDLRESKDIPINPFLKNWQKPTIKRALLNAVKRDADYFAWINGEQTSARYNLATHLDNVRWNKRSEEHTSELQSHSFISYAVFCLKKKKKNNTQHSSE